MAYRFSVSAEPTGTRPRKSTTTTPYVAMGRGTAKRTNPFPWSPALVGSPWSCSSSGIDESGASYRLVLAKLFLVLYNTAPALPRHASHMGLRVVYLVEELLGHATAAFPLPNTKGCLIVIRKKKATVQLVPKQVDRNTSASLDTPPIVYIAAKGFPSRQNKKLVPSTDQLPGPPVSIISYGYFPLEILVNPEPRNIHREALISHHDQEPKQYA